MLLNIVSAVIYNPNFLLIFSGIAFLPLDYFTIKFLPINIQVIKIHAAVQDFNIYFFIVFNFFGY